MVSINYSAREVCCKIVYYGPGLSGKTTNLQYVHAKVPGNTRGKLISLATEADRTLYFDFLPINIGTVNGFAAKFQLYTVPGQVYYNATRKLVLRGVDGIVFVADSQPSKMDENIESLTNLEENLREYGYDINDIPVVIQYNKRDLPGVLPVDQLEAQLNPRGYPIYEASATVGNGVFDTLKLIIKLVLDKAKNSSSAKPKTLTEGPALAARQQPETPPSPTPDQAQAPPETAPEAAEEITSQPAAGHRHAEQAEEPEPVYRPYPGGSGDKQRPFPGGDPSPASQTPSGRTAVEDRPGDESEVSSGAPRAQGSGGAQETVRDDGSPRMAPSLRKKPEKKRGFFKRLFGMK